MGDAELIRFAHTGTTWEVGDIVVGNKKASEEYTYTITGCLLRIDTLNGKSFEGTIVEHPEYSEHIGRTHWVAVEHFDFHSKAGEHEYELPDEPEYMF